MFRQDVPVSTGQMQVGPAETLFEVDTPGGLDWGRAEYLVVRFENTEDFLVPLRLVVEDDAGGRIEAILGTVPTLAVPVAFPLAALDAQNVFQPREPGRLKTFIMGTRVRPQRINRLALGAAELYRPATVRIHEVYLTDEKPKYNVPATSMVDPLGQATFRTWSTQTPDESVMIGEFHFGAPDAGPLAAGLRSVATQPERGRAYRRYVEFAAAQPDVVGTHYFTLGRFDGECF